jgi:hypothetical protein
MIGPPAVYQLFRYTDQLSLSEVEKKELEGFLSRATFQGHVKNDSTMTGILIGSEMMLKM